MTIETIVRTIIDIALAGGMIFLYRHFTKEITQLYYVLALYRTGLLEEAEKKVKEFDRNREEESV